MSSSCIVIGAGAAGLMASLELLKEGHRVTIVEARDRMGGRIYTVPMESLPSPVEAGAEFIHGQMPLTIGLLKNSHTTGGDPFQLNNGKLVQRGFFDEQWLLLLDRLRDLDTDMSFAEFLQQKLAGAEHENLRQRVTRFVEGYNAARVEKASALALRDEWLKDEKPEQHRPEDGYGKLIETLSNEVFSKGAAVHLSEIVQRIDWAPGKVSVRTQSANRFEGDRAVITVPPSVLRSGTIRLDPALPQYLSAANDIGFGSVIKFHIVFRDPFWETRAGRKMHNLGFLFSDSMIPTWWTQLPSPVPLLTGWLGGPPAEDLARDPLRQFRIAVESLSYIFDSPINKIESEIVSWRVTDWASDPFARGAYSYSTLQTDAAKKILNTPIHDTLYFAGEALDNGPHTGTVEAALSSGKTVAREVADSMHADA